MKLEGIHHITAITENAQRNVDFYAGVLGLRLVKKTVNQDSPTVYHLFFADEGGDPGSDLTFFEYPGAPLGRAGAGMVHRVVWRVASTDALDFWEERLAAAASATRRDGDAPPLLRPRGARPRAARRRRLRRAADRRPPGGPARAGAAGLPRRARLQRRRPRPAPPCSRRSSSSAPTTAGRRAAPSAAASTSTTRRRTSARLQGAGIVHHVAWASTAEEHMAWRDKAISAGARPTPEIDRFYFKSVYFREPSGVLFEIATIGPGFTVDEPLEHLGEKLSLPPDFEHLRDEVEPNLRPVHNPRSPAEA